MSEFNEVHKNQVEQGGQLPALSIESLNEAVANIVNDAPGGTGEFPGADMDRALSRFANGGELVIEMDANDPDSTYQQLEMSLAKKLADQLKLNERSPEEIEALRDALKTQLAGAATETT